MSQVQGLCPLNKRLFNESAIDSYSVECKTSAPGVARRSELRSGGPGHLELWRHSAKPEKPPGSILAELGWEYYLGSPLERKEWGILVVVRVPEPLLYKVR